MTEMAKIKDRDAVTHGTFYFVHLEDDFAVAAIDSRANYPGSHRDDAIKIVVLGDFTIFLCQGISIGEGFSATEVAKRMFAQRVAPVDPYELATNWATEMRAHIEMLWKADPGLVNSMRPDTASGVFLGHADTNSVSGAVAQIKQETPSVFKQPCIECSRAAKSQPEVMRKSFKRSMRLVLTGPLFCAASSPIQAIIKQRSQPPWPRCTSRRPEIGPAIVKLVGRSLQSF